MIPLNQEQRLGRASYYLMVSRRTSAGFGIVLFALVFLVLSGYVSALVSSGLKLSGAPSAVASASSIVMYIDAGIWILGLLVTLIGVIIAKLEYSHYTFAFEEFDMRLKRGIFTVLEVSIPYRSMQDVDIERNIMHRMTRTSRVIIDSAGEEEPGSHNETEIVLDPINREAAEDIRLMLQRKIGVQVVKTEADADRESGTAPQTPAPAV